MPRRRSPIYWTNVKNYARKSSSGRRLPVPTDAKNVAKIVELLARLAEKDKRIKELEAQVSELLSENIALTEIMNNG